MRSFFCLFFKGSILPSDMDYMKKVLFYLRKNSEDWEIDLEVFLEFLEESRVPKFVEVLPLDLFCDINSAALVDIIQNPGIMFPGKIKVDYLKEEMQNFVSNEDEMNE